MKLHAKARDQLRAHLEEGLPRLIIENGMFVDRMGAFICFYKANEALPRVGKLHEQMVEYIDDYPLIVFCSEMIASDLRDRDSYIPGDVRSRLSEMAGYEDIPRVAECLLSSFESLPWNYTLTLKLASDMLPTLPADAISLAITPQSQLTTSHLFLNDQFPLTHPDQRVARRIAGGGGALGLLVEPPTKWDEGTTYFQASVDGFIGAYGAGSPVESANRSLKSFVGLGLALRLLDYKHKYNPSPRTLHWLIHRQREGVWQIENRIQIDADDAQVVQSVSLWNKFNSDYPEVHKLPWLQGLLLKVHNTMQSPRAETIKLASQWFFDSFKGKDEVLSYVRRMTCLEILLGERSDSTKLSVGELIGNRLSYLIGRSHQDRMNVLMDFRSIYSIRSKILHHGKHRLVGEERVSVGKLQAFCERAIQAEAQLLTADTAD